MRQSGGFFLVSDNSGGKKVQCIRYPKQKIQVGDLITVSIKQSLPPSKSRVRAGEVHKAVICELKQKGQRLTGITPRFDINSVVLVDQKGEPLGTRVFCLGSFELRKAGRTRIASLAPFIF